jgi:glycosyltransferase involved in cell wall biosynthesis
MGTNTELSPQLIVAAMVRNEADRFLRSALSAWGQFADDIIILDDSSTDNTKEICTSAGANVIDAEMDEAAWGKEALTRAKLFNSALEAANEGDYIFFLDADMVPARNPRSLMETEADAMAFVLYDLWANEDDRLYFRNDTFWQGHLMPRVWMIQKPEIPEKGWTWNDRGIHCGHLPLNLRSSRIVSAPSDYGLLHYAYLTPSLRAEKASQYLSVRSQLTTFEVAHASSIEQEHPQISPLPFTPEFELNENPSGVGDE